MLVFGIYYIYPIVDIIHLVMFAPMPSDSINYLLNAIKLDAPSIQSKMVSSARIRRRCGTSGIRIIFGRRSDIVKLLFGVVIWVVRAMIVVSFEPPCFIMLLCLVFNWRISSSCVWSASTSQSSLLCSTNILKTSFLPDNKVFYRSRTIFSLQAPLSVINL